jgi:hypothetical protein
MVLYVLIGAFAACVVAYREVGSPAGFASALILWVAITAVVSAAQWLLVEVLSGHAPRNRAFRPVTPPSGTDPKDPESRIPLCERWYLETNPSDSTLPTSCSFIEFDEHGDYLDFWQHRHAYEKILSLARTGNPLTVVVYVHGWRHSGQSHDVLSFNAFLSQLSAASAGQSPRRVHGVYLAWRGGALKHVVPSDAALADVTKAYGGDITSQAWRARTTVPTFIFETFSYFDRKSVPEHMFSGTQLSRSVFSCAFAAKRNAGDCQVLLMGHSFGGLMLERTIQNATIGELTEAWPWGAERPSTPVNPLPFDTVLIVNSAAPSIYAKQFQSYLAAHRQAMVDAGTPGANTPFVFSVTSTGDLATGLTHPIANSLSFLVPSLRRIYLGSDFALERVGDFGQVRIPQYYYYRHTPGHNPLLVNRFIEPVAANAGVTDVTWRQVHRNLNEPKPDLTEFDTTSPDCTTRRWRIVFPPTPGSADDAFSRYDGRRPVVWTQVPSGSGQYRYKDTAYWIMQCPKEIIKDHNDIWSQAAMDMYAALHRISLAASTSAGKAGV